MATSQNQSMHLLKDATFRPWSTTCAVLLGVAIVLFMPQAAFSGVLGDFLGFFTGSTFYCSEDFLGGGPVSLPVNKLYDNGIADCSTLGINHLFSGFVCQFEHLVSEIFGKLYCGVQFYMQAPLAAFLTLFITFIGVGFLTSYLQFTAKEVVMIFFKIALVWVLATQSDVMISYVFNGFLFFMQATVYVVLKSLMHNTDIMPADSAFYSESLSGQGGLFTAMDNIINNIVSNSISASMVTATNPDDATKTIQVPSFMGGSCKDDPLKIIIAIGLSMPPLFMILVMTFVKLLMVLLRTLLGYLLCMTGIMFLLTLSPIFLSLGLFHITKGFFTSWLSMMTGFAVQVFVMFAFLALALGMLVNSQFTDYKDNGLIMNWGETYIQDSYTYAGKQLDPTKGFFCTLCEIDRNSLNISFEKGKGVKCAEPRRAIPPTALYRSQGIVELLSIKIFMLALVAYLFESILNLAPQVASQLAQGIGMMGSSASSPSIGTGGVSAVPLKGTMQTGKAIAKKTMSVGTSGNMITEGLKSIIGVRNK